MDASNFDESILRHTISEFFAEVLQVILLSRSPCLPSSNVGIAPASGVCLRDTRFNLQIRECPANVQNIGAWCGSNARMMVVDVILIKRSLDLPSNDCSPRTPLVRNLPSGEVPTNHGINEEAETSGDGRTGKVIERWVLHYDVGKGEHCGKGKKWSRSNIVSAVEERLVLLLRSLYVTVRLLPAYKTTRDITLSRDNCPYSLAHRVSSFAEPFNDKEDEDLLPFGFVPVDTPSGRLCIAVLYQASAFDLGSHTSSPISPRVISNYFRSTLADPLKRFAYLPVAQVHEPLSPFSRWYCLINGNAYSPSIPRSLLWPDSAPMTETPPSRNDGLGSKMTKKSIGAIKNCPTTEKIVSQRRDKSVGNLKEEIPLGCLPQISFFRCYSQSSWHDSDPAEITCPFNMDDDYDLSDCSSRPESSEGQGHVHRSGERGSAMLVPNRRSQDAFVGALVDMLKRAPPLRRELQHLVKLPQHTFDTKTIVRRTTADAMEELKSYKEIKCSLLGPQKD